MFFCLEILLTLCEVVVILKVIAGVIERVNIDYLNFAKIVFAENFQHIVIIPLYEEIFGVPKIDGRFNVRMQSLIGRSVGKPRSGSLIVPVELIPLFVGVNSVHRQLSPKFIKVDNKLRPNLFTSSLSDALRI